MLTIGKLARDAAVAVDTVRYYEKERLLAPARRTAVGYRLYGPDALRRLRFIRHAQQCGFSLGEIRELLELRAKGRSCCGDVRGAAVAKRAQIVGKIEALQALSRALGNLIDICVNESAPLEVCPILSAFEAANGETRGPRRAPSRGQRPRPRGARPARAPILPRTP